MKLNFSLDELCEFRIMTADHLNSSTQAFLSDSIGQPEAGGIENGCYSAIYGKTPTIQERMHNAS